MPIGNPSLEEKDQPAANGCEHLRRELLTALGREAEKARLFEPATLAGPAEALPFAVSGCVALASPGRQLIKDGVARLGRELLERWLSPRGSDLRSLIRAEVPGQLQAEGLNPQSILADLRQACTRQLGKTLEDLAAAWLGPVAESEARGCFDPWNMKKVFDQVERFLGPPQEEGLAQPAPVAQDIGQAAEQLGQRYCQALNGLLTRYLDRPGYRLAALGEAVSQLTALMERDLRLQESQVAELGTQVRQMADSLRKGLDQAERAPASGAGQARPGSGRTPLADLAKTLAAYPPLHCRHLLLLRVRGLYLSLRGYLTDQTHALNAYRQAVTAVQQALGPGLADRETTRETRPQGDRETGRRRLLSSGLRKVAEPEESPPGESPLGHEALDRLVRSLTAEDWLQLDQAVQAALLRNQADLGSGTRQRLDSLRTALAGQSGHACWARSSPSKPGLFSLIVCPGSRTRWSCSWPSTRMNRLWPRHSARPTIRPSRSWAARPYDTSRTFPCCWHPPRLAATASNRLSVESSRKPLWSSPATRMRWSSTASAQT